MRNWDFCTLVVLVGLFLSFSLFTSSACAVVAFEGDVDSPADDFGFANIGTRGSLSGVYLGDRWVLTARHAGAGDITFNGITYHYEEGSAQAIKNPTNCDQLESVYTDLTLYRLIEEPELPSLKIATTPPSTGTELYLAGNSLKHQNSLSYWTVDRNDWSWEESEIPTSYWGYKIQGSYELNWGRNQVIASFRGPTDSTHFLTLGNCDMVAIKTRFDSQQSREAQAVSGDSGGGAFYFDDEEGWVLAGIISCIEVPRNTPTYAIAGATTCCVDLSFYRDSILEITSPNTIPETIPGDANGDGVVNGMDVTILAGNWQQTSSSGTLSGDFNHDGVINGSDVTILANHWHSTVSSSTEESSTAKQIYELIPATAGSAHVPEPATWILLLWAVGSFALYILRKEG